MVFATVRREALVFVAGEPARRASTSFGERWFCRDCGTPLAMIVDHEPDTVDFTVATLDTPEAAPPGFHIWTESRVDWFDTSDALPRHARRRADGAP